MFPTFRLKPWKNTVQKGFEVEDLKYISKPWIPFYDHHDAFLWQMLELGQISPTWGLCERAKLRYVMGGGFALLDGDYDPNIDEIGDFDRVTGAALKPFREWARGVNQTRDCNTLYTVTERAVSDFDKTGNAYILCKWYKVGSEEVFSVFHLPSIETRLGRDRESVWWSEHFRSPGKDVKENQANQYSLFPVISDDPEGNGRCAVIHVKNHEATHKFYGLPSSIMGTLNARSEYQAIRFRLTQFENNWSKDGVLILSGISNSDEVTKAMRSNIDHSSGEGANGGLDVLPFQGDAITADLITYDKDQQGEYLDTTKLDSETIFEVHGLHPSLVGRQTIGKLGGRESFAEKYTLVSGQVVTPVRNKFISEVLGPIAEMAGFGHFTPVLRDTPESKTLIAMTYPGGVPETVNERRNRIGMDIIEGEKGEQILGIKNEINETDGTNNSE